MRSFASFLAFSLAMNAFAAAPDCKPGAEAAKQKWISDLQGLVAKQIDQAVIYAYKKDGVTVSENNIFFQYPISEAADLSLTISVGDIQVTGIPESDTFAVSGRASQGYPLTVEAPWVTLAQTPEPVYNGIGRQTGWSCTSTVKALASGFLFNKATDVIIGAVIIDLDDKSVQKFPL